MRYDVHYRGALLGQEYNLPLTQPLQSLEAFDACYRYVGTFEVENLDELYALLQDGGGGLGDRTMQDFVLRHVQHTSMDVGDIVIERDTGRLFQVLLDRWQQISLR